MDAIQNGKILIDQKIIVVELLFMVNIRKLSNYLLGRRPNDVLAPNMSTLSDVQALYGTVQDTWSKSRAHVIAHVVLAVVVFGICGATVPDINLAPIDLKLLLSENEWYKLAKDTGIIYVALVLPLVILAAYGALLRTTGQFLVSLSILISPPSAHANQYRLLAPGSLEPIALTLAKSDFSLSDLQNKASELMLRYQSQKNEQWDNFQQSISKLTKNAQVYLGDFLLFLLLWITLFNLLPHSSWIQTNEACFWRVALVLSGLAWFAWFRVSRTIAVLPSLLLIYVSAMIQADPDIKNALEVSDEKRDSVRKRLEELLRKEEEREDSYPSLLEFIRYKAGFHRRAAEDAEARKERGFPFPSLYKNGARFSWDEKLHTRYDRRWLSGYFAYLYYRLHIRLVRFAKAIWQLARYIITGAP